jgi:hypothetical protein
MSSSGGSEDGRCSEEDVEEELPLIRSGKSKSHSMPAVVEKYTIRITSTFGKP